MMFVVGTQHEDIWSCGLAHSKRHHRYDGGARLLVLDYGINPRLDIQDFGSQHTDEGLFTWGPEILLGHFQLAVGLLGRCVNDDVVRKLHVVFATKVLTKFDTEFSIDEDLVFAIAQQIGGPSVKHLCPNDGESEPTSDCERVAREKQPND